jgi:hypothetical protein
MKVPQTETTTIAANYKQKALCNTATRVWQGGKSFHSARRQQKRNLGHDKMKQRHNRTQFLIKTRYKCKKKQNNVNSL